MLEGKTKEETIRLTAKACGIPEIEAAFIEGWVSEVPTVLEKLVISLVEIAPLLLVLPAEEPLLPGIGEPVLSPLLRDPALRCERQPLGIDRPGLGMLQDFAEIQEVLLGGGSLRASRLPPFVNEGSGIHQTASEELGLAWPADRWQPRGRIVDPSVWRPAECFDVDLSPHHSGCRQVGRGG